MPVIVIVGLARTGKDTAADYIASKYGYAKYTFSSVLSEMIEKRGEQATKEKMIKLGDTVRKQMGMDAVAKILSKKVLEKDNVLLVGPRSPQEIEYFKARFPELIIVKITAKENERFERKSEIDPKGKKEFFERDKKDLVSKGFQKALDMAKIELKNDSTEEKLHSAIDKMMAKIQA
ncbi:MAG TPA: AAA family ATPase [archaeon]|nr:AAA family ATPase [archaeon]